MIITTQENIPNHLITEVLGVAKGNTIRARHLGKDIVASLRTVVGGEIKEYTKLMAESREQAIDRMKAHAEEMGANAIVCVRFTTSVVMEASAELLAYGTAVKVCAIEPEPETKE